MPDPAFLVLAAIAVLMLKHTAADFFLQSSYQCQNKGIYGHRGGLIHSGIHVALTPLAYLVIAPSLSIAAAIAVGEFAVHYHVDWAKEQFQKRSGLTHQDRGFWRMFGTDQLLHGLTYVVIVGVLAAYAL